MRINPTIEQFYIAMLKYAGLELKDDVIVNSSEHLGGYTIDDKDIALPYMDLLKNPNGRAFFHPLNENYLSPENALFNLYKNRLTLELNLRLTTLITSLITVASDIQLQKKMRSSELMEVVSRIGDIDLSILEAFLGMVKASSKQNKEGFLLDLYLKKNGSIGDVPYAAIGKINFRMAEEIDRSLNAPEKDYKVFGVKFRKKDLIAIGDIFSAVFDLASPDAYTVGTDNKVFRYLNVMLKTAYGISETVNSIGVLLAEINDPQLHVEDIISPHDWVEPLGKLQGMATEIRLIPSQVSLSTESKRLNLDETKAAVVQQPQQQQQPSQPAFDPSMVQQTQPQVVHSQQHVQQAMPSQQAMQPQQPQQLTPEEIIRGSMGSSMPINPMMPQLTPQQMMMIQNGMMPNPNMGNMMQPSINTPDWIRAETMAALQRQAQPQQYQQPGMMPQQFMPQQQFQQPGMMPQQFVQQQQFQQPGMMPQQFVQQQYPQQGGIAINPLFQNNSQRMPWQQ